MKDEKELDDMAPVATLLGDAAEKAMSVVPDEMKSVCVVHDLDFRDLLEAHVHVPGD